MEIHKQVNSRYGSMTYWFVVDRIIFIVDPGDPDFLESLDPRDYDECRILLTHAHFDHIYGVPELLRKFEKVSIFTNEDGAETLCSAKKNLSKYQGEPIEINREEMDFLFVDHCDFIYKSPSIRAIFTPGHHPSCITWMIDGECFFTGDSYIPGIPVVTNLPGGRKELARKWENRLKELSEGLSIYPGHKV